MLMSTAQHLGRRRPQETPGATRVFLGVRGQFPRRRLCLPALLRVVYFLELGVDDTVAPATDGPAAPALLATDCSAALRVPVVAAALWIASLKRVRACDTMPIRSRCAQTSLLPTAAQGIQGLFHRLAPPRIGHPAAMLLQRLPGCVNRGVGLVTHLGQHAALPGSPACRSAS
jgi:hypothetical protein